MKKFATYKVTGMVCVLALGAAACGAGSTASDDESAPTSPPDAADTGPSDGGSADTSGTSPPSNGDPSSNDNSGSTIDASARVRVAFALDSPAGFDPHRQSTGGDSLRNGLVYDSLLRSTSDGLQPGLAVSWEWAEDGNHLDLLLRDDVVFQDGAPFDAAAAKASLDRARTVEGSTVAADLASIAEVEVVADLELRLHTDGPNALILPLLAEQHGAMISPTALDDPGLASAPVGAGRYQLVDWEEGQRVLVETWDGYWDSDEVRAQEVELIIIPDAAARWNALRTNQVDVALLESSQAEEAATTDDVVLHAAPGLTLEGLLLNRTRGELADERVRQALNFAIDREAIANALHFGYSTPTAQWYPEGYVGHSERADELYPYDPERAIELLEEAGLPSGFAFEVLVAGMGAPVTLAEALQAQFARVGVEMTIRQVDRAQAGSIFYSEQQGDAIVATPFNASLTPLRMAQAYLHPESAVGNPGGHTTPEWEDLIVRASSSLSDEHDQIIEELMFESTRLAANVIVGSPHTVWATRDDVVGFTLPQGSFVNLLRGVGVTADS